MISWLNSRPRSEILVGSNVRRWITEKVFQRFAIVEPAIIEIPTVMIVIATSVHIVERTVRILVHSARKRLTVRWRGCAGSAGDQTVGVVEVMAGYFPLVVTATSSSTRCP
jgi:hypothetical protein